MTPLDGQEREALRQIEDRPVKRPYLSLIRNRTTWSDLRLADGEQYAVGERVDAVELTPEVRAALAAREEPPASELGDLVRRVCDEWVHENGVGPTSDWHVQRLLPLADQIDAALAREDWIAERSDVEKERDELRAALAVREPECGEPDQWSGKPCVRERGHVPPCQGHNRFIAYPDERADAIVAAREEPQPPFVTEEEIAQREQHQYELGFNRGQAAARVSVAAREDTERPDEKPREWLVEANENARNPHVSYWRVLGEPRLEPSERIYVVEVVRDTEQKPLDSHTLHSIGRGIAGVTAVRPDLRSQQERERPEPGVGRNRTPGNRAEQEPER